MKKSYIITFLVAFFNCQSVTFALPNYDKAYFSDRLIADYNTYAETQIKDDSELEDILNRLGQYPQIRQDLLAAMYPDFCPEVLACFGRLVEKYDQQVLQYPHLAIAFSIVYGAADATKENFRSKSLQWWVSKNRDVPSLEESFAYYINNRDRMLYPLDTFPWPLLIYVADNDIPLEERDWVLNKYSGQTLEKLDNLYGQIKHNGGAEAYTRAQSQAPGNPMALNRIFADGGVCSQQAYYSSRVLKSLGVPSVRLLQPGHTFMTYVCGKTRLGTKFGGDHTSRKYEYFFNPRIRNDQDGYEFQMLVSAIDLSYERWLRSKTAAVVFTNLSEDSKKQARGLLDAVIDNNRYTADVWLLYADACRNGVFTPDTGPALYDKANELLPQYPELLCIILNKITAAETSEQIQPQITAHFKRTLARLQAVNRPDLAYHVFTTHFDFLVKTEGLDTAVSQSSKWFNLLDLDLYFQQKLFDRIFKRLNNVSVETKGTWLYKEYLRSKKQYQNQQKQANYFYFSKVALACIDHYREAGNTRRVAAVNSDISHFRGDVMNEKSLNLLIANGTVLGAAGQEVTRVAPSNEACYVWQILYDIPKGYPLNIEANHAKAGNDGAFCFTAWSDSNKDGLPDKRVATSELKSASRDGQWSRWTCVSDGNPLFVGITMKTRVSLFYQNLGQLEGYAGLSSRMFYTRTFDDTPHKSVEPRYINLRVTITERQD